MAQVWRPHRVLLGLAALLALATSPPAAGREIGYQIIVNPANPTRELTRAFLRDAFLKRTTQWSHGPTVRPVDFVPRSAVREVFSREVLGRGVAEVKRYWQQQIFSGKNVPPPELDSDAEVIAFVLKYDGAIGYLPTGASVDRVRVVAVK